MVTVRLRASALLYWLLYSRLQPSCSMARTDEVGSRQPIAPATNGGSRSERSSRPWPVRR